MTIPGGNPPWMRTMSAASYGAHASLRDYGGTGAINANTDITAEQYKRLAADVAAAAMVAPLAVLTLRWTVSPNAVFVASVVPQWAPAVFVEYAGSSPPSSVYPSVTLMGNVFTVTFPSTATDDYGVSGPIIPRVVVPASSDILWGGPTDTSVFTLTSDLFTSDNGSVTVLVF